MRRKILLGTALLFITIFSFGQDRPKLLDDKVIFGQLDNGMTYYILANIEPKEKASFYMVQDVGAILEEDHQDGLAHMLEHMAFNGSTHFPGKGIKNFLERNGVEFGKNINAYTNVDETVYNMSNVPSTDLSVLDSFVWILHDWSGSLTLDGKEIDAERGVINEEWRTRNTAERRIYDALSEYNFKDSQYAVRNVIGEMDIINNSEYEAIRSFYKKWYRPDLQAAIIVGDFNAVEMEQRVKKILSQVPPAIDPAHRIEYEVAGNEEMIYAVATDKEARAVNFNLLIKHPVVKKIDRDNEEYLRGEVLRGFVNGLLGQRLQEASQKPDAPFLRAYAGYYPWIRTSNAMMIGGQAKENQLSETIQAIFTEVERARKHGFVETELDRLKANYLTYFESRFKKRDKISNDELAKSIQQLFLVGEPHGGIEFEYEFIRNYYEQITAADLQPLLKSWLTETNRVFTLSGPEGVTYVSEEELNAIFKDIEQKEIEPYFDLVSNSQLVSDDQLPKIGKITKQEPFEIGKGGMVFTLDNGCKVVLYPTDKTKSEVLLSGISRGGASLLDADLLATSAHFGSIVGQSGAGDYTDTELKKILAGKNAGLSLRIGENQETISGRADTDDLEVLFKLLYLRLQFPRSDEDAFKVFKARLSENVKNKANSPNAIFGDSVKQVMSNYHERAVLSNPQTADEVTLNQFDRIYKERFKDQIDDFTFFLVGDFEITYALPLLQKYIGSLESGAGQEKAKDHGITPAKGGANKHFKVEMTTPKFSNVYYYYASKYKYTAYNNLVLDIAADILKNRYFEQMREDEGGTYGAGVWAMTTHAPRSSAGLWVQYDSNPDKAETLAEIVKKEMMNLIENGAKQDELNKSIEAKRNARKKNLNQNGYLLGQLTQHLLTGIDGLDSTNYESILDNLNLTTFNKTIKTLLGKVQLHEVVMEPR
ncbi:MAG: insulinase family protein [Ekhidna sp.]|nr:insulinase family protein [Ekhidna sp.]